MEALWGHFLWLLHGHDGQYLKQVVLDHIIGRRWHRNIRPLSPRPYPPALKSARIQYTGSSRHR